jgi:transposase
MTLNSNNLVDMPTNGVIIRKIGKYNPVYKTIRSYRNAQGKPTNDRVTIGKMDLETGKLIPNSRYWDFYGDNKFQYFTPDFSSIRHIGGTFLVGNIMNRLGLTEVLDETFGVERGRLVRTAALYMASRGNIFDDVDDFCEVCLLSEAPLSSQTSSNLFASITYDEKMSFFKRWIAKQPPSPYLAYDVTSFSTYAKDIIGSEYGYNRDGERLPQINLGCFVSETTGRPVFFVNYPGSIVDKSHLPYIMAYNEELGITDIVFVLDRGFCSTSNIKYLEKEGYKFIIGVEKRHKNIKIAIDFSRECIDSIHNRIESGVFGMSSPGCYYGVSSTLHVYHDHSLGNDQIDALCRKIDNDESLLKQKSYLSKCEAKKFHRYFSVKLAGDGTFSFEKDRDKIDLAAKYCGFYCLLTNLSLDKAQLLAKYRRRDVIEKSFDDLKNYISMKRLRTHKTETTNGKLFCSFISLIIATEIATIFTNYINKNNKKRLMC